MSTKIIVTGAAGRMGQRILALAGADPDLKVVGTVDISDSLEKVIAGADAVIDFSHADATVPNLRVAAKFGKAVVIGTTGHAPEQLQEIRKISEKIPVVMAPNMSLGVNVLWKLIEEAAKILGSDFPVSVRETHHVHKKDAPSGTALKMMEVLAAALGKKRDEIPVTSLREGEEVGDHSATFAGAEETLTLRHQAKSRDTFALGALRAAKWVVGKPHGLYSMKDVLQI